MTTRRFSTKIGIAAAGTLLASGLAWADTVPLAADAYLVPGSPVNYGSSTSVYVGGATAAQGLLQFDLSRIPAGTTVTSATLRLFVNKLTAAGGIDLLPVTGPWSEAGVTGSPAPGSGAAVASGVAVGAALSYVTVDVTAQVQAWVNGAPNNGLLIAADPIGTTIFFDSKESSSTSHPATLNIELAGPAGPAGLAGQAGATGSAGPTGATGPAGPAGSAGAAGAAGSAGATGPTGATGPAGISPAGAAGAVGAQGPNGPTGATGPAGVAGAVGAAGAGGPPGVTGPTGPPGNAGAPGAVGAAGPNGAAGPTGPAGATGPQGVAGPAGANGPTGINGPMGLQGAAGAAGATGATGPAGPAATNLFSAGTLAATATISDADSRNIFFVNIGGGTSTITLPHAVSAAGKMIHIRATNDTSASNNNKFTINPQAGDLLFTQNSPNQAGTGGFSSVNCYQGCEWISDGVNRWLQLTYR